MSRKFLILTGTLSALVFGGTWLAADPQRVEGGRAAPAAAKPEHAYFPNCAAARAAGKAPLRLGQPGYRPALDADGDGIACEPYRGGGGSRSYHRRRRRR